MIYFLLGLVAGIFIGITLIVVELFFGASIVIKQKTEETLARVGLGRLSSPEGKVLFLSKEQEAREKVIFDNESEKRDTRLNDLYDTE